MTALDMRCDAIATFSGFVRHHAVSRLVGSLAQTIPLTPGAARSDHPDGAPQNGAVFGMFLLFHLWSGRDPRLM